jgi:phenylacetate-CoA ligase
MSMRESLLGPSYFYHRHLIEESKSWSPDQIREYQEKHLRLLTRRYGNAVTEKEDYRRDLSKYTRWDVAGLTHFVRTGGTSFQPLRFKADTFSRRQKERAYLFDIWSKVGYKPHDLRVQYRGDVRHGELFHFNRIENAWLVSPAETVEQQLGTLREWIQTLPPFFLHVFPSSLRSFIDLIGEDLFRRLPVRGVLASSEAFLAGEQARFEEHFGISIAHWYGHSEYAALAYSCRDCHGFHFYPTYGQVEFLPSDTDGCQRIVATSFNRIGTQFIRYDTGDLGIPPEGSCPADNFPRVSAIVGRSQETFVDSAGRKRSLFDYAAADLEHGPFWDHIQDLQFVQDRPGFLRIRVVPNPGGDKELIQRTFTRHLPMVSLDFEYVPVIQRSPSGKRRYFVDSTPENGTANADHPQQAATVRNKGRKAQDIES